MSCEDVGGGRERFQRSVDETCYSYSNNNPSHCHDWTSFMRVPSILLIGPRKENRGRVGVSAASHDWLRVALGPICYWRSFHHCSSTARTRRPRRSPTTALCSLTLLRVPLPAIAAFAHTATVVLYTAQSRCAATKPPIRSLPHSFQRFIPSFSRTVS